MNILYVPTNGTSALMQWTGSCRNGPRVHARKEKNEHEEADGEEDAVARADVARPGEAGIFAKE